MVESVAAEAGASAAQVALAWLHHQASRLGVSAAPIPGTRRPARIEENLAALDVALTDDQLDRLGSVEVVGGRSANPAWVSEGREGG